jgi:adenosylcobinamide-GDP ribazoletransferase
VQVADLRDNLNLFARQFALALQRSTRLHPGGGPAPSGRADDDLLRTSTRHLPGAGWLLGLLSAFVFALVALALRGNPAGPAVAAVLALFASVLLTGGAPERGVFRVAEALAPQPASGQGTLALVLLLAARIAAVAAIGSASEAGVLAALFAAPVVSRFAPLPAQHWTGRPDVGRGTVQVGALWCVVPLLVMGAVNLAFLLLGLLAAAIAWITLLRFLRHHPGPFDDDRAACLQQACELAFYLGSAVGA